LVFIEYTLFCILALTRLSWIIESHRKLLGICINCMYPNVPYLPIHELAPILLKLTRKYENLLSVEVAIQLYNLKLNRLLPCSVFCYCRQKRRRIEVALIEYRETLEEQGMKNPEEIERKVEINRKRLEVDYGLSGPNEGNRNRKFLLLTQHTHTLLLFWERLLICSISIRCNNE